VIIGAWAYGGRQDNNNNVDAKIASAVAVAKEAEAKVKDAQFAEESKNPFKTYKGSSTYGSLVVKYPKTWSAYVRDSSTTPYINGYFAPNIVPDTTSQSSTFALRIQVLGQSYSSVLKQFQVTGQTAKVSIKPYALPKVPGTVGAYISGQISSNKNGYMVILPLRNTTVRIWTESEQYKKDFNNIILANASFSP
jgi:hypothetical protein